VKHALFRAATLAVMHSPLARVLARGRRGGVDAELDVQVAAALEGDRLLKLPALDSMDPPAARVFAGDSLSLLDAHLISMAEIIDTSVAGKAGAIPVRIFVPPGVRPDGNAPWIVYFHGGGGVIGSIRESEPATRLIAAQSRCIVASVEYRLGPEHKHPAAIDDALAAFTALAARAGKARLAVAGDSFGGFLAAHCDHDALVRGARQPDLQVLIYPTTDLSHQVPSIDRLATGYVLTKAMIEWFDRHYMAPSDDRRAASPMFWSQLRGSAPALIVTCGYDPLVDEGDRYAERLEAAGNRVILRRYPSLIHGFLSMAGGVSAARVAIDEMCGDIRGQLAVE
jgi:acetyl esterase